MHENVTVTRAGAEAVDDLRALFLALHRHHRSVTDLPLVADDEAWRARRGTYLAWFAEGRALLFVARAQENPVGYALVVWHEGADDTFPLAPRYAELYTLSVAEGARGTGVGGRLLDAVDEALADAGDPPLTIAVMARNSDALRFYARRGLVPGEMLLYRFGAARVDSSRADPAASGDARSACRAESMIALVHDLELLDDPSGVRVVVLSGEQDLSTAGALRLALAGAREAGCAVVVELSIVSFIDSTILGVIIGGLRDCKEDGRGFAVVASSSEDEHVPRLLGLSGMRAVFPIYELRSAAVEQAAAGRNAPS